MGCVSSKHDINDQHPNLFQVTNVNDNRELMSPGQLEITESEIILHQKGRTPLVWPLRTLRKYGFDQEIFTFECGRRCPTGEGIYAFQCRRAEQLFNIVQQNISRNVGDDSSTNVNSNGDFLGGVGPPLSRRMPSQIHPEGYLTPLSAPNVHMLRSYPAVRPGSITCSGPISPPAVPLPNVEIPVEHNNNKRGSLISTSSFTYTNTSALDSSESQPKYANLAIESASSNTESYVNIQESICHVYMNVDTKDVLPSPTTKEIVDSTEKPETREEDNKHCYANIDAKDIEQLRSIRSSLNPMPNNLPQTSNVYLPTRKVNYAKLDFDTKDESITPQNPPESPNKPKDSYAVIDFHRTNALSQSINPTMDVEEGVRKTRHNSSISDIVTRTSSSLSD